MEPVTTTAMIGTIVGYLAKKLKDNQSIQDFFSDFTSATVAWIRPLFLKNDNENEKIIADLIKKPDSTAKLGQVEMAIASHLEDNPQYEEHLKAMFDTLQEKASKGEAIHISNSKNVNTGKITAGGNVIIGDQNIPGSK